MTPKVVPPQMPVKIRSRLEAFEQACSLWWMVTPNRDRSVSIPRLEEDWEKAKLKGQGEIVRWASQHLNMEIGLALAVRSLGGCRLLGAGG